MGDGGQSWRTVGDSTEGVLDPFDSRIGSEPVFCFDARDKRSELSSEPSGVTVEGLVNFGREIRNRAGVVACPVLVEEVIKVDVDDDTRKTASLRREKEAGLLENRMTVGEAIDAPVHHDSLYDGGGESFSQTGGGSLLEVA